MEIQVVESHDGFEEHFKNVIQPSRRPVIIKGLNLGPCQSLWSDADYVKRKEDDKHVKVHITTEEKMDFRSKNFKYAVMGLHELVTRAAKSDGEELIYLRATGDDPRGRTKVIFDRDFPKLAEDFKPPTLFDPDRLFSSVLRISSPGVQVQTWIAKS